jgi:1-acyl-sn-glycerol-3-phosphate acyltransferase
MAYVRAALLALVLAVALGFVVPFQALARRYDWRVSRRIPVLVCRTLCAALRLRVVEHGVASAGTPRLFVANHVSWTDILVLGSTRPLCFVAKSEVAGWPGLGALARVQDSIFVDRNARFALPAVNAAMAARMAAGEDVVLFPEATTGEGNRLKRFHAVHFAAARDLLSRRPDIETVTVQPVAIVYAHRDGLPLGRLGRLSVAWFGDSEFLPHLWDLLRSGPVDCRMIFAAPLPFSRTDERKAMARSAQESVRALTSAWNIGRGEVHTVLMRTEKP